MSKLTEFVNTMQSATQGAKDFVGKSKQSFDALQEIRHKGGLGAAADAIKKKAKDALKKLTWKVTKQAAKSTAVFLVSNPVGWAIDVAIIILVPLMLQANQNNDSSSGAVQNTATQPGTDGSKGGTVSVKQYAAMAQGCATPKGSNTSGSSSSTSTTTAGQNTSDWSLADVTKFGTSDISSTWNVSDSTIENWYVSRNVASAVSMGVTASNIGQVTNAVKAAGVSPVYFYIYSAIEGGGAGGFINHFAVGQISTDPVQAATQDANYVKQQAQVKPGKPATEPSTLPDMPTDDAQKYLDAMPAGSIGNLYVQATAAATMDVEQLAGKSFSNPHNFGPALRQLMSTITTMGGDVNSGTKISAADASASSKCQSTANVGFPADGMTVDQAKEFMKKYQNAKLTDADRGTPPADWGVTDGGSSVNANCTLFSSYFLNEFTNYKGHGGDGKDFVANLVGATDLKSSSAPVLYGVFSIAANGGPHLAGDVGHTGIILGLKDGQAVIGEAAYGYPLNDAMDQPTYGISVITVPVAQMTAANGWSFTESTNPKDNNNTSTDNSSDAESAAKQWIVDQESHGDYNATNGRFIGKYQLDAQYLKGDYSPANQDKVADEYVKSRYGSWVAAKAFHETHNWY